MATYLVTFQIDDATRRNTFRNKIRELYKGVCPLTEHAYVILTENLPEPIRDGLTPFLDAKDRIYIIKCSAPGAWRNAYSQDHTDWLKKYL